MIPLIVVTGPMLVVLAPTGKGLKRIGAPTRYFRGSAIGISYGNGFIRAGRSQSQP